MAMQGSSAARLRIPTPVTGVPIRSQFKFFQPEHEDPRDILQWIISQAPKIQQGSDGEEKLRSAAALAMEIHEGQLRKDKKTPYIRHPLAALFYALVVLNGSYIPGCAAMLHDGIEEARKRGMTVNYAYLLQMFGDPIATDVAYLTTPLCAAKYDGKNGKNGTNVTRYVWVPADDPHYNTTLDIFASKDEDYPPEVYKEMRAVYFERLVKRIGAFVVKLCEAIDNLSDIRNLSNERRFRKLAEDRVIINIAARMDWSLYELMDHFMRENGVASPDFSGLIGRQQRQGVVVCRPRDELDFKMASRELPLQHPSSPVVTVYMEPNRVFKKDDLEVGLPRIANGSKLELLQRYCSELGIVFIPGRSLFHGYFDLGAREAIYAVNGLAQTTHRATERKITEFLFSFTSCKNSTAI